VKQIGTREVGDCRCGLARRADNVAELERYLAKHQVVRLTAK
jgi:hypothetical protein